MEPIEKIKIKTTRGIEIIIDTSDLSKGITDAYRQLIENKDIVRRKWYELYKNGLYHLKKKYNIPNMIISGCLLNNKRKLAKLNELGVKYTVRRIHKRSDKLYNGFNAFRVNNTNMFLLYKYTPELKDKSIFTVQCPYVHEVDKIAQSDTVNAIVIECWKPVNYYNTTDTDTQNKVEKLIKKYLGPDDVYIKFKDDDYILVNDIFTLQDLNGFEKISNYESCKLKTQTIETNNGTILLEESKTDKFITSTISIVQK